MVAAVCLHTYCIYVPFSVSFQHDHLLPCVLLLPVAGHFLIKKICTLEPLNKGRFGASHVVLCWEVVLFSEVLSRMGVVF